MKKLLFNAKIPLLIIIVIVLLAILADALAALTGNDPYTYHLDLLNSDGVPLTGPTLQHWFGVEPTTGRDLFAIVTFGARTSLIVGLGATILSIIIGVIVGLFAGYHGGKLDIFLSQITNLVLLFPALIFMIALSGVVPDWFPRILLLILIIGCFGWGGIARVVRNESLRLKNEEFIVAAKVMGVKNRHIIFRHILPNLMKTVLIFTTISVPAMIGSEAALSFLGVGITAPTPSWGRSIAEAINWIYVDPWFLIFPAIFLFAITLAFNVLGDKLGAKEL
ncbi:MAG: ABC transporter permease [Candidatus Ancillula sp.]|nr:ABC transporter permease [Candidatus Ancillula sp.]